MNALSKLTKKKTGMVVLAPLAGVSDSPFRRVCQELGADLTYVEMISATALVYQNERTLSMLYRHESEERLGVQITSRNSDEMAKGVAILDQYNFDTVDINMGCPVKKVVVAGCGSAIMKDLNRVQETVKAAVGQSRVPVSVKTRLGWDQSHQNYLDVLGLAIQEGASWVTLHGRTRADDYGVGVNLEAIKRLKDKVEVPVLGNGNLMAAEDMAYMQTQCGVDGGMIARGALGNPWIFSQIKGLMEEPTPAEWAEVVCRHLTYQKNLYKDERVGSICMRKHLLWYLKGWPEAKGVKERVTQAESYSTLFLEIEGFAEHLISMGVETRVPSIPRSQVKDSFFDPKFDLDRQLDRGVGEIHL